MKDVPESTKKDKDMRWFYGQRDLQADDPV